eukprot:CAMPEP_0115176100 /NCGR_PEP_ID=MMETSP0270-20121206/4699_1 /TAXON_ID=71861 /ORGANISM="Scrippsiella trochoidea, Strain CCMP3099" /LENGTH=577 /DNA_ID=CAMNT_0002588997 /DNA_START=115 /DNA_END=1848 /DNA_ORIENTATION=+
MSAGSQPISEAPGYVADMHVSSSPDRSRDRRQRQDVKPLSARAVLCSSPEREGSRSFSDDIIWDNVVSPTHADAIRQLKEQQARCRADVTAMEGRLISFEKKLLAASERMAQATHAGRVPILIGEQQPMRRVSITRSASATQGARVQCDVVDIFRTDLHRLEERHSQEMSVLSKRLRGLTEQHNSLMAKLEATPDVAVLSARLADVEAVQRGVAAKLDVLSELPSLSHRLAELEVLQSAPQMTPEAPLVMSMLSKRLANLEALHHTSPTQDDDRFDGSPYMQKLQELEESHYLAVTKLEAALAAARRNIARLVRELHWEREDRKQVLSDVHSLAQDLGILGRVAKELRSEMKAAIAQESAKQQRAIDSRMQLVIAELQGGTEASIGLEPASINLSTTPEGSLTDWLAKHADGDIESTKSMLMHLCVFEHMAVGGSTPNDLLSRPTIRFLHRVVVAIKHATGYPPGILEDWPGPAEAKVDFIRKVWDSVATTLGLEGTEFKAQDVLHCTNRKQTRRLLQLLAIAASKERGWLRRMPGIQMSTPTGCNEVALPSSTVPVAAHSEVASSESNVATSACWH